MTDHRPEPDVAYLAGVASVSPDRTTLTIRRRVPGGVQITTLARSSGQPWTQADIADAVRQMEERPASARIQPGERRWTRRYKLGGRWRLYVHVNTGPPTWWYPRFDPRGGAVMVGWLRALVAVSIRRANTGGGEQS